MYECRLKRTYEKPEIEVHGNLKDITKKNKPPRRDSYNFYRS